MQSEFELETRVAQGRSRSRDGIGYETYGDTIGEVYDTLSGGRLRRVNLNEARSIAGSLRRIGREILRTEGASESEINAVIRP